MKISPRTVLKIARLYHLADDNTPVKALRHLKIQTDESHIVAEFILDKQHFAVLYGSIVDEESIDQTRLIRAAPRRRFRASLS